MRVSEPKDRPRTRRSSRRRQKWVKRGLVALPLLVLLGLVWVAWTAWSVYAGVQDLKMEAQRVEDAVARDDLQAASTEIQSLEKTAQGLHSDTASLPWRVLSAVPLLGDDASAIATVSKGAADMAFAAVPLVEAVTAPDGLIQGDQISVATLEDVAQNASAASAGLEQVVRGLDRLATSRFGPLRSRASSPSRQLQQLTDDVHEVSKVLEVAPRIVGSDQRRNYLLLFQNNAEIRATGGLPGSAAWLTLDDGKLSLRQAFSPITKTKQNETTYEFTAAERALYGDDLDIGAVFVNSMPDAERVAELLRTGWDDWFDEPLHGVITLDTVGLSYLLGATGPVDVEGRVLTEENVVQELLFTSYQRLTTNEEQDSFFEQVSAGVFGALTSSSDPAALLTAGRRLNAEERISAQFFERDLQRAEIAPFGDADSGVVAFNNVSGDKMTYFFRSQVDISSQGCAGNRPQVRASATLRSTAPLEASGLPDRITEQPAGQPTLGGVWHPVPLGSMGVRVVLAAPRRAELSDVRLGGELVELVTVRAGQRPTSTFVVELAPGETLALSWQLTLSEGQSTLPMRVTPGMTPGSASSEVSTSC